MYKRIAGPVALIAVLAGAPLRAQNYTHFAFNIGGGVTTPLPPTSNYAGISGNFTTGAGYNIDRHNSFGGEFMWAGLPPDLTPIHPVNAPFGRMNLYTLTANYRYRVDKLGKTPFGVYVIGGGGWYYRYASVDKNYVVAPNTVCQPIWTWWGYACDPTGYVYTASIANKGVSAGGINAGGGFTIRLTDGGWKFYVESRYHRGFSRIPSVLVPVTFGFRYN